jgi:hypothetical protein
MTTTASGISVGNSSTGDMKQPNGLGLVPGFVKSLDGIGRRLQNHPTIMVLEEFCGLGRQ